MRYTRIIRDEKTVRIDVELEDCVIKSVILSGDFFAYPEDIVERLEDALRGCGSIECVEKAFMIVEDAVLIGTRWDTIKEEIAKLLAECTGLRHGEQVE